MMNAMFQRCRNEATLHKDFINSTINPARMDEVDAAIHKYVWVLALISGTFTKTFK